MIMHLLFVNLGAKSQPNSFDGHRFETLCLQHTLAINYPESWTIKIINFAMLCVTSETRLSFIFKI